MRSLEGKDVWIGDKWPRERDGKKETKEVKEGTEIQVRKNNEESGR